MTSLSLDDFNAAYGTSIASAPPTTTAAPATPRAKTPWYDSIGSSAMTGLSAVPIDFAQFAGEQFNPEASMFGYSAGDLVAGAKDARSKREDIYNADKQDHPVLARAGRYIPQALQLPSITRATSLPGMMAEGAALGGALGGLENPEDGTTRGENARMGATIGGLGAPVMRAALGAGKALVNPTKALSEFGATGIGQKILKVNPQKVAQYEGVGIEPSLAEVSDSGLVKGAENILGDRPFIGKKIQERGAALGQEAANKVGEVIDNLNPKGLTKQQIGEKMMGLMSDFKKMGIEKESKLHQGVEDLIGADTPISVDNLSNYVSGQKARVSDTPGFGGAILNNKGFKTSARMAGDSFTEPQVSKLVDSTGAPIIYPSIPKSIPYETVKEGRSALFDITDDALLPGRDKSYAKRGYAALSNDLREGATKAGQPALDAFNAANKYSREFRGDIDRARTLYKTENPELLYQKALAEVKSGDTKLKNVAKVTSPEAMENLGGGLLKDISTKNGELDIQKFGSAYRDRNKLSPEAKKALFGANEDQLNKLDQFESDIADRLVRSGRVKNDDLEKGVTVLGLIKSTGATITALTAGRTLSKIISDPKIMTQMQRYADNPEDLVAAKELRRLLAAEGGQGAVSAERKNRTEATVSPAEKPTPAGYTEWYKNNVKRAN